MRPGSANTICDVPGLRVGHAERPDLLTGTTVILPDRPAVAAVDARGGGIGSRDLAVLAPESAVTQIHAIALSGGSAFGLDAGGGAMRALADTGAGFAIGPARVPIVPTSIIFDLLTGGLANWDGSPWWQLGHDAVLGAKYETPLGNVGAGLGATAGTIKGGVGSASLDIGDGVIVGALVVANPVGMVTMPKSRAFWAWAFERDGEFAGAPRPTEPVADLEPEGKPGAVRPGQNTTIGVVATNRALSRNAALRVAIMAQDGLARAIRPVHAPLDGDTLFALSTGDAAPDPDPADLTRLGSAAADCVARAVVRGVVAARQIGGVSAWTDLSDSGTEAAL